MPGNSTVTTTTNEEAGAPPVTELLEKLESNEELSDDAMMRVYEESFRDLSEGDVVVGRVLQVRDSDVIVDIGYKSEGIVHAEEFRDPATGEMTVSEGDEVEVLLERREDLEGNVVVSREKAERMKVWGKIEEAYEAEKVISGRVIDRVKGGLSVDIGVRAFLPGSQVDIRPVRNLETFKGEEIRVKVIKVNKRRANVVVSRKAVLEVEREVEKQDTLEKLLPGNVLGGVVKNITDYGCFIDLGGIDGLLHITDMSWGRISHPTEMFSIGDVTDVVVLNFDPERERVSLGYKQLQQDPWIGVTEKFPPGSRMRGRVVSLTDYGAFVELEEGVEGLVHISEMSWSKRIKHPSKLVSVDDQVDIVVLDVDEENRRISLGMKQTEPNPWRVIAEKYSEGDVLTGRVRNLTDFGAFVEIDEGIDGLIHISDMSWTKRVDHPSDVLQKGQEVEVAVLNVDVERQRLSLGLKQLRPNIWDKFSEAHHVGEVIEGKITKLTNFGAFVELDEGIEGLVHVSEIADRHVKDPADELEVGETVKVKVLKIDAEGHKIALSMKEADGGPAEPRRPARQLSAYEAEGTISMGDVVGDLKFPGMAEEGEGVEDEAVEDELGEADEDEREEADEDEREEADEDEREEADEDESEEADEDEREDG